MTKKEALSMIDNHRNKLIDPVDVLRWTHLRVIILTIDSTSWNIAEAKAHNILTK